MSAEEDTQPKASQDFINAVKKWVQLDDEIKEHSEAGREMKSEKKELEMFILDQIDNLPRKEIDIGTGWLRNRGSEIPQCCD